MAITRSSFRLAAEHLEHMAESSSFRTPWVVLSFTSTSLAMVLSFVLNDAVRLSRRSALSADGAAWFAPPVVAGVAKILAAAISAKRAADLDEKQEEADAR